MAIITLNNNSLSSVTSLPAGVGGSLIKIASATASSDATISFTSGIDSTYDIYKFELINIHGSNDDVHFMFQFDTGTNTNYNQTISSTHFIARHLHDGSATLGYSTTLDSNQGTGFEIIATGTGNDNDQSTNGEILLYNPASTTFQKYVVTRTVQDEYRNGAYMQQKSLVIDTTSAITRVQFKMSVGNIDSGTIILYGVKS